MKTLYLHGMGGKPNEEKISWMNQKGLETYSLHMDYNNEPNRFEILLTYCQDNGIQFLVGSSFGGFLAFWLSEELGIPCLLLNPALSLRAKRKTQPTISHTISPLCLVALGSQDDVIDHQRTLLYMEQDARVGKIIHTKVLEGEGHGFTMPAFEKIIDWSLEELKNLPTL